MTVISHWWLRLRSCERQLRIVQFWAATCLGLLSTIQPAHSIVIGATESISFLGRNVTTDSFDSADPLFSDNGQYPFDPVRQKDKGDIAVPSSWSGAVMVGNAKMKGRVFVGTSGFLNIGPSASIGSKAWVEDGNLGVQPGYFNDIWNVPFPPVTLPTTNWLAAPLINTTIEGINYGWVLNTSGDYYVSSLTKSVYVGTNASVRLLVLSTANLAAPTNAIRICHGGRLQIYMYGATFKIGGRGILNDASNAMSFIYYGIPANTKFSFVTNTPLIGSIYAPHAECILGGGGGSTNEFIGSVIAKKISLNNDFNFHFDENLNREGLQPPTIITPIENQTILLGQTATFNVETVGTGPMYYQWSELRNTPSNHMIFVPISGATNSSLSVTPSDSANHYYKVIVSNPFGQASTETRLSIYALNSVLRLSNSASNQITLNVTSLAPGTNYVVFTSTNLMDWEPVRTNTAPFSLVITNNGEFERRFYRAAYVP